ncbi:MAG: hypothetical protein HYS08_09580 [Chlamydiae bacterium]|nr:hypothetical protein [Chlamydiota bacterium]MBI3265698.1 hypothetical protein [Chlamydiota bacterium]
MHLFLAVHPEARYGIRFSSHPYSIIDKIDSRPLYAVASLAHEDQRDNLRALAKQ